MFLIRYSMAAVHCCSFLLLSLCLTVPCWVLPYFKKSEANLNIDGLDRKYHNTNGEQSVSRYPYIDESSKMMIEAYIENGIHATDVNGENQLGAMLIQTFSKNGERVSTNNAFIEPIRGKRKNLIVKVESEVCKILINKNKAAYGVKYTSKGKVYTAYANKEVIVSAGSINSPKLLMLSGIGPKEHLSKLNIRVKKDLAVGENLHDHQTFNAYLIALSNETSTLVEPDEVLEEVIEHKRKKHKNGPLSARGPFTSTAFLKSDLKLPAPDIQIVIDYALTPEFLYEPSVFDRIPILPNSFYNGMYPRIINLVPKNRGKLLLNPQNPRGKPLIYANYFEDPVDFIPLIMGARCFLSLGNTNAFKSRGAYFVKKPLPACKNYEWGTDDYTVCIAKAYTSSTYHPVSTCKMGPKSDRNAVVDPRLRVYGIAGLRVIDASIMPYVVRGNKNAPSIMIGERGAAFIIETWHNKSSHNPDKCGCD